MRIRHQREHLPGGIPPEFDIDLWVDPQGGFDGAFVHRLGELNLEWDIKSQAALGAVGVGLGRQGREGRHGLPGNWRGRQANQEDSNYQGDGDRHHQALYSGRAAQPGSGATQAVNREGQNGSRLPHQLVLLGRATWARQSKRRQVTTTTSG